jgi:DNA helicase II / ATP-dependent DNA helicase PcrA
LRLDRSPEAGARLENLKELTNALQEFDTLPAFLEHVALLTDNAERAGGDMVSVMTLHAAKGLEFPVVFIVGCEDGLLPLRWSGASGASGETDEEDVREERRLLFVGMTRAQRHLYLSHAAERVWHGATRQARRSSFLDAMRSDVWERIGDRVARRKPRATQLRLL